MKTEMQAQAKAAAASAGRRAKRITRRVGPQAILDAEVARRGPPPPGYRPTPSTSDQSPA